MENLTFTELYVLIDDTLKGAVMSKEARMIHSKIIAKKIIEITNERKEKSTFS